MPTSPTAVAKKLPNKPGSSKIDFILIGCRRIPSRAAAFFRSKSFGPDCLATPNFIANLRLRLSIPNFTIPFIAVVCLLAAACSPTSQPSAPALLRAQALSDRHYTEAAACLDSIDPSALSANDRHFYDFLSLKVADKAYVQHTSDSTILALIRYASRHHDAHYAETLYYGGRVYSDLGDYPTALQYFQQALDALPSDTTNSDDHTLLLRGNILSQTGRLLNNLRLYDEAVPYIEAVLDITRLANDSVNEVYDLQLLGANYLKANKYNKADSIFHLALQKSAHLPVHHQAKSKIYLAGAKFYKNELDSAVYYICNTKNLVTPIELNTALVYACKIYLAAGMLDSAYNYAYSLIKTDNLINHNIAYDALLSPQLRHFSHPDTLIKYVDEYSWLIEHSYDENENQLALTQQAYYNYRFHEREKAAAESRAHKMQIAIIIIIFIAMSLGMLALWQRNRLKTKIINLHEALSAIAELKKQGNINNEELSKKDTVFAPTDSDNLRKKLIEEILSLYDSDKLNKSASPEILDSIAYAQLRSHISDERPLSPNEPLWKSLENTIVEISPNFKKIIYTLTGGHLSQDDYHTIVLIKFYCKTSEICMLLSRSENAILSRREKMSLRMFDRKLGSRTFDAVIRLI